MLSTYLGKYLGTCRYSGFVTMKYRYFEVEYTEP